MGAYVKRCHGCAIEFAVAHPSDVEGPKSRKYCTVKCRCLAYNRQTAGAANVKWKGGRNLQSDGYVVLTLPNRVRKLEHRHVAERALGRTLKRTEVVHHVNMDKSDNRNCNLLVCSQAYHVWLEHRYAQRFAEEHFAVRKQSPAAVGQ